jgi:hypothetical protein
MFNIPFFEFDKWDRVNDPLHKNKSGIVYELSAQDILIIDKINERREAENNAWRLRISRRELKNDKDKYTGKAVCARTIKRPGFEEYYEALDKIKPFSEREIVEVRG